jgi:hypothetical protein
MNLTIIHLGIIRDEVFHVHQAGCADVARNYTRMKRPEASRWNEEHDSVMSLVLTTYACQIEEDGDYDGTLESRDRIATGYLPDFRFFPCCDTLPTETPTDKETA